MFLLYPCLCFVAVAISGECFSVGGGMWPTQLVPVRAVSAKLYTYSRGGPIVRELSLPVLGPILSYEHTLDVLSNTEMRALLRRHNS